jgi:hypothetical protein
VVRDREVRDMGSKCGLGFDDVSPVGVVVVKKSLMMRGAAVVPFEFGRGRL